MFDGSLVYGHSAPIGILFMSFLANFPTQFQLGVWIIRLRGHLSHWSLGLWCWYFNLFTFTFRRFEYYIFLLRIRMCRPRPLFYLNLPKLVHFLLDASMNIIGHTFSVFALYRCVPESYGCSHNSSFLNLSHIAHLQHTKNRKGSALTDGVYRLWPGTQHKLVVAPLYNFFY